MQSKNGLIQSSTDGNGSLKYINGWYYLRLSGTPYEIGFQHGELLAQYIARTIQEVSQLVSIRTGMDWDFFRRNALTMWESKLGDALTKELKGIVDGVNSIVPTNLHITFSDILTWNGYEELTAYWFPTVAREIYNKLPGAQDVKSYFTHPGAQDHCSAFIANGDYTKNGQIIMAHNSFLPFTDSPYCNVIIEIKPADGYAFKMQSQPGYIHSFSDFYVNKAGLAITETTIGGFCVYAADLIPEFIRIRQAVQYADTLDAFTHVMLAGNNGGCANTWLIGDYNTNEMMRLELGLKFHTIDKCTNGYFVGFNAPLDPRIRQFECTNTGFTDIRRHQGARQVRLPQLMEQHKGKIDLKAAKAILSDHYDIYTQKDNPCSRTVCAHYEVDPREYMSQSNRPVPFEPRGAVDGVVCSANTVHKLGFSARYGSSCGKPFIAAEFLKAHPQFDHLKDFLTDRPSVPWTNFY